MIISDFLEKSAQNFPDNTAVSHLERKISYRDLYRSYSCFAGFLENLKLAPGSRVALFYENSIEYNYLLMAVFRAGYVAVPLDNSLKPENVNFIISDCGAEVLIFQTKFKRFLPAIIDSENNIKYIIADGGSAPENCSIDYILFDEILSGDTEKTSFKNIEDGPSDRAAASDKLAAIFYTSGSTGSPKGVMLSHRNLISNTLATIEYLRLGPDDSIMVILPYYYIYGNSLLMTHVAVGGRQVIDNRFMYPEVVLDNMEKEAVTGFSGVPSNFMILLNKSTFASRKFENLRYMTQAGGAMAPEIIRKLMKSFPEKEIYIMYGQTEASPRVTYLPPEKLKDKIGSIGIPVPGVNVDVMDKSGRIVPDGEAGEITVTGDNVMMGYWNQAEEEKEVLRNGRLFTGDLGRKDADGYIYVIGRKKEIIKTGGNRVSAKEIEERILENTDVSEVAVFGIEDDLLGEAVKAVIVLKEGVTGDLKIIQNFCREKLADHKVPKYIDFVDALPKYQTGKVDKMKLAKN
jgi:acyl-CoA synthetase (AMP-forming)/AMP-acid ligase II